MRTMRVIFVIGCLFSLFACATPLPEEETQESDVDQPSDTLTSSQAPISSKIETSRKDVLNQYIATLSDEQKVGQLLMPTLQNNVGDWTTTIEGNVYDLLTRYQVGGFIFYRPNIVSATQVQTLILDLQSISEIPLIFSIDVEGGSVNRLSGLDWGNFDLLPDARTVGGIKDVESIKNLYQLLGGQLRALGITMNMAPVADVLSNPRNSLIGSRSFGADVDTVAAAVVAAVEGQQQANVSAVLKHFPGHGNTERDSHSESLESAVRITQFQSELEPFLKGITSGVDAVMINHVRYSTITGNDLPASLSPVLIDDVLRGRMGFRGVVITDSLNMEGLLSSYPLEEAVIMAVNAGADILLRPRDLGVAYEALLTAVRDGAISEERLHSSVYRVLQLKQKRGILDIDDDLHVQFLMNNESALTDNSVLIRTITHAIRSSQE